MNAAKESKQVLAPPPHGWVGELAKLTGFSRVTVRTALRNSAKGVKAEKVRQLYREKYGKP